MGMVSTFRVRRPCKVGPNLWRQPGELYPEAHTNRLVEAAERTGKLVRVNVPEEEFYEALDAFITDEAQRSRILAVTGLAEGYVAKGPSKALALAVGSQRETVVEPEPSETRVPGLSATPAPPRTRRVPIKGAAKHQLPRLPRERVRRASEVGSDGHNFVPIRELED